MTDGMEIQEVAEEPKETREVSEEAKRVDAATFEPEAVIEREMDYETAEAVEKAFVEVVQESSADEVTPTAITFSKEIGETIDEGEEASITIEKAAESVEEPGGGDVSGQLDGLGDDSRAVDKFVVRDPDGSDGGPEIDYGGLENTESIDLSKPTDISDAYGPDSMSGANQGEGVGYMGDMMGDPTGSGIEIPGGDVEIPGVDPGGEGGGTEVDPGLPGYDQDEEMQGLAGMAAPGADGRISDSTGDFQHQINLGKLGISDPEGAAAAGGGHMKDEASGYPQSDYAKMMGLVGKQTAGETFTPEEEQFVNEYAKAVENQSGSDGGSDGGGDVGGDDNGANPPTDDSTPTPDDAVPGHVGDKSITGIPEFNPVDDSIDYFGSLSQPVGTEESSNVERPLPMTLEEIQESGLDPLINWGDDSDEGDEEFVGSSHLDADITPSDPPDMAGGGEGGIEDTGSGEGIEDIDP